MGTFDFKSHNKLMSEIRIMRSSGELIKAGNGIKCPIHVIHGKEDSHPYLGVVEPFKSAGIKFEFSLINKCGHTPWREKYAKEEFIKIISESICRYFS